MKSALAACFCLVAFAPGLVQAQETPDVSEEPVTLGTAYVAEGDLFVHAGDYEVKFVENVAWTFRDVHYRGKSLLVPVGWQQSVLRIQAPKGEEPWIGTGHGGEVVEKIQVRVGDKSYDVQDGLSVAGDTFVVHKESWLGPYWHVSDVTVSPDGLAEDFRYEVKKDTSNVIFMYVFMHCFTNDTQEWIAKLSDGEEVRGTFLDDNSFTLKKDIRWAAVYAPKTSLGAVYVFPEAYASFDGQGNMFWNRPHDNKLYLKIAPKRLIGETFAYSCRLRAFDAPETEWESAARETMAPLLEP